MNKPLSLLLAAAALACACKQAPSEQAQADTFKPASIQPATSVAPVEPAEEAPVVDDYALLKDPAAIATRCQRAQDNALIDSIGQARAQYVREDYAKSLLTAKAAVQRCPDGELIGHMASCYEALGMTDNATRYRAAWAKEKAGEGDAIAHLPELAGIDEAQIGAGVGPADPQSEEESAKAQALQQLKSMGIAVEGDRPVIDDQTRRKLLIDARHGKDMLQLQNRLNPNMKIDPRLLKKLQKQQEHQ
jgi:hypothetical protein